MAAAETLRVTQVIHDTVRDTVVRAVGTHQLVDPAVAQVILAGAALVATVIFGLPPFWQWIENGLPPKVTILLDLSADEMFALDRLSSWSGSKNKRYAVVRVKNRRGIHFTIKGGRLDTPAEPYPVWFQSSTTPRVLEPKAVTYYQFEMDRIGDPARATVTLMSHDWQRTFAFQRRGAS